MKEYVCPVCKRKMYKRVRYSRSKRRLKKILWCKHCYDWVYADRWEQFIKSFRF